MAREQRVEIRMTATEKALIAIAADRAGRSMANFILRAALKEAKETP